MDSNEKIIDNTKYLLTDIIQGDNSVFKRKDFSSISGEEIKSALKLIINNNLLSNEQKKYILMNVWRIHYRRKPPTIQEFLTTEWLGNVALSIYDHVRKDLEIFWNPFSSYRHMVLASAIGYGKSFECAVSVIFLNVHLNLMRNAKKFFGLNQASSIVSALISFSLQKANQILLQPFYQILLASPKFRRVRKEESLEIRQEEYPNDIIWTSASKIGSIQFTNDLHILVAANPYQILGLTLIAGILSELSFFIDRGISPETIWRIYNDTKSRIYSRFGHQYFASSFLDSSPNDMEVSPIDKYIFSGKASEDPLNYVRTGTHWEVHPSKYPLWQETKETFPLFRGNGAKPPKLLVDSEIKNYTITEIYNVPIDVKQNFIDDLKKSVKDYCGWPSGSDTKLFDDFEIIEKIFSNRLKNIYSYIYAPASRDPEKLIWNQIRDIFFVDLGNGQYEFYRSPNEDRYIHIDQSESGNLTSIGMVHPEITKKGKIVQVVDFTISIAPTTDKINLDAITEFLIDLKSVGKIPIAAITFDQFQSTEEIQKLKRLGFEAFKMSVERSMNPYLVLVSWIKNKRVKSGKNIFLKNNLKSIQEILSEKGRKKIDHLKGREVFEDGGDWDISVMGINAKDVSDSLCGAVFNSINLFKGAPRYTWDEDIFEKGVSINKGIEKNILKKINDRFSLITN